MFVSLYYIDFIANYKIVLLQLCLIEIGTLLVLTGGQIRLKNFARLENDTYLAEVCLPEPKPALTSAAVDFETACAELEALMPAERYEPGTDLQEVYIRPGDLLHTVKIPPLIQTFKFREKKLRQ